MAYLEIVCVVSMWNESTKYVNLKAIRKMNIEIKQAQVFIR